jgi:ring-1,2-phenylacetyl-CoA epoxidase subunit PaaE
VQADAANHYVALAAGSGITPMLSILTTILEEEPGSSCTLVYGNRTTQSIMFLEELEALKDLFHERFQMIHVLSREANEIPLFEGRIDAEMIRTLTSTLIAPATVTGWYMCGPLEMVEAVNDTLQSVGVDAAAIHYELFFDERIETIPDAPHDVEGLVEMTFTLDGRSSTVMVDPQGPPLLDYARSVRADAPFACKGGMCATCKGRVTQGEARMDKNFALTPDEVDKGLVLTCQSHPVGDEDIVVTYDIGR